MNLKQAARRLGVHYQTAYRWVRSGKLAALRVGAVYDISDQAIEKFEREREAERSAPVDLPVESRRPEMCASELVRAAHDAYRSMVLSPSAVFEVVSDGLAKLLGGLAMIQLVNADETLVTRAMHHSDLQRLGVAWTEVESFTRTMTEIQVRVAIATRKPVRVHHLPQDHVRAQTAPELVQYLDDARPHTLLAVPALYGDDVRAVITLVRDFPAAPYSDEDVTTVGVLAAIVGAAIVRCSLHRQAWDRRRALMAKLEAVGAAFEQLPDLDPCGAAELICSPDGEIVRANKAAGELGAIDPDALIGMRLTELPVDEEQCRERDLLRRLAAGELSYADALRTIEATDGTRELITVHRGMVRNAASEPTALVIVAERVPLPDTGPGFRIAS